jgi:hypothetical protein
MLLHVLQERQNNRKAASHAQPKWWLSWSSNRNVSASPAASKPIASSSTDLCLARAPPGCLINAIKYLVPVAIIKHTVTSQHYSFNSYNYSFYLPDNNLWIDRLNTNGDWTPGDFVIHFPGMANMLRINYIKIFSEMAVIYKK